jgi:hypothetical protein
MPLRLIFIGFRQGVYNGDNRIFNNLIAVSSVCGWSSFSPADFVFGETTKSRPGNKELPALPGNS